MTDLDNLTALLQRLDEKSARYAQLDRYYAGESPLSYMSPESKRLLGNRMDRLSVGIPRLLVDSIAERLRVTGFTGVNLWADWLANDLDQQAAVLHREALTLGAGYVIVWADPQGRPNVSVESARQVVTVHDPGSRRCLQAVKRWEADNATHTVVYEPDRITRWRANHLGALGGFVKTQTISNPLGWVPVVRFANTTRVLGDGESEMSAVTDLTDAITKLTVDMMVASETTARPRRWATGLELTEDADGNEASPIAEGDRLMVNEAPEGKFGQLPGSDLSAYTTAIQSLMRQVSAVSGLPDHMLGLAGDNPTSADAIRASEAALTAKAEARQGVFGRQWEHVARLMVAVRDGIDPDAVNVSVQWADPSTRSVAQEADAVVKLFAAGLLPQRYALKRLGYTDAEITTITEGESA